MTNRPVGTTGRKNQPCQGGQGGFMEEKILGGGIWKEEKTVKGVKAGEGRGCSRRGERVTETTEM